MNIGTHIHKSGSFIRSLRAFYETKPENLTKPVQLFSGSPKWWRRPGVTLTDYNETKTFITENNLNVFIHSLYLVNLCWAPIDFRKKALPCLQWEFNNGMHMGFKGVVVHCGKSCKMDIGEALDNMYNNLITVLKSVSTSCPLLLETTSGQGSETCWQFEELKKFYKRFTEEEKQKIKICIDTCHVFAAGHDPIKFILDWDSEFPESIVLVHFNDSKGKCDCKKDRHERPGKGEIGLEKMCLVAAWCFEKNIPMVME